MTIFVGIALGVLLGSIPLLNVPQPVKLGLAGGPLIVALLLGRFGPRFHLVTYTTMSANLMLREVGIALFLAAVGLGAGDGFIDAIVGGGYRWIGYGALITVIPLLLVGIFARARLKMNYYTLMGLMAGSMTDPPALAYANGTAGNDMPALSYSTVYPVVMFCGCLQLRYSFCSRCRTYDAAPVGAYVTIPTPAVVLRELSQILQKGCNPASENRASFLMGGLISIFSALFSAFCYL